MCNAIKAESKGRLQITVFANSTLSSQASMLAQLRLGSIHFMNQAHSVYASIVPISQISSLGYAFSSEKLPLETMDGPLGAYIRRELEAKGIYAFEKSLVTGFREITSSIKPIRTADDFVGFKVRVIPAPIFVDLFKTLGASPLAIDANETYTALQTHLADGEETGLVGIEGFRYYEVQKYLSLTNHIWGGQWLSANLATWNALPADLQEIAKRNAVKYALLVRRDSYLMAGALTDKLHRQGLAVNVADTAGMRARLGPYYAHWKSEFGAAAWGLLEASVGPPAS